MRGHVIRSFLSMPKQIIAVGHQLTHERFQVISDLRIGILTKHQRGAGVLHENFAQAGNHTRLAYTPIHLSRDIRSPTARCRDN